MAEPAHHAPDSDDSAALVEAVQDGVAAADAGQAAPYEAVRR